MLVPNGAQRMRPALRRLAVTLLHRGPQVSLILETIGRAVCGVVRPVHRARPRIVHGHLGADSWSPARNRTPAWAENLHLAGEDGDAPPSQGLEMLNR